ncbi:MAG: GvpL/GvpF family gas vesicle protein [Methanotrichaceae archaeon]
MIDEAKYLYSVASCAEKVEMGRIGLEESLVYTIPYRDIAAIVHSCESRPYSTEDKMLAEGWILEHSYVIDQATKRFGTVLPFSFDVIIRGDDNAIEQWLSRNYDGIKSELDRVKGKSEYSIQIFYDRAKLASEYLNKDQDVKEIDKVGKGKAYLLQKKLNIKINDKVTNEIIRLSDEFGARILALSDDVKVEKRKASELDRFRGKSMMTSFACLVSEDNVPPLGDVLDEINNMDGFAVRFTGPWAPFSFVNISEAK